MISSAESAETEMRGQPQDKQSSPALFFVKATQADANTEKTTDGRRWTQIHIVFSYEALKPEFHIFSGLS